MYINLNNYTDINSSPSFNSYIRVFVKAYRVFVRDISKFTMKIHQICSI